MTFIYRTVFESLKAHLAVKQATVITGMRRTGKTTLVKQLMAESSIEQQLYLDLERYDNRLLFSEPNYDNIVLALSQRGFQFDKPVLLALDEIQLVPNLPSVVKYLYDTYQIKFLLTGSSSYYLKNAFQESLAGRKQIFEVFPLGFLEYLRFQGVDFRPQEQPFTTPFLSSEYERLKSHYDLYIRYGGFPEVSLASQSAQKEALIADIVSSYINIDIGALSDIKKLTDTYKLLRLLVSRCGSKIEISKLCQVLGLSRVIVENYLDLLEYSYMIHTVPVHTNNTEREIVKAKKLYFADNGILNHLGKASSGAQFENCVFNQLRSRGQVQYYQLKSGEELDFVLNAEMGLEVKETVERNDFAQLHRLAGLAGLEQKKVVYRYPSAQPVAESVWGGFLG